MGQKHTTRSQKGESPLEVFRKQPDSESTAHRWPCSNRLIFDSEYRVVQVLAVTGLQGATFRQLESFRSIRFSFCTQENGAFVLFVEETPRKLRTDGRRAHTEIGSSSKWGSNSVGSSAERPNSLLRKAQYSSD